MPRARKGRGGARQGTPGKKYANRSDLRGPKVMAIPGQTYGKQAQQVAAQQIVPPGPSPASQVPQAPAGAPPGEGGQLSGLAAAMQAAAGFDFKDPGPIDRETEFPDEPVTAGSPFGPGPGPEAMGMSPPANTAENALRALYLEDPNEDLRELIEELENESLL